MNGVITSGNYSRQEVSLTGDTEVRGGNWCFAKVTTNGHSFVLAGGNYRGIYLDGVKQDAFTLEVTAPDNEANALLPKIAGKLGPDGLAMWNWLVDYIVANPAAAAATAKEEWKAWSTANDNAVYFDLAVLFLQKTFGTWANLKTQVLAKTSAAWKGLPVPTGEVIS